MNFWISALSTLFSFLKTTTTEFMETNLSAKPFRTSKHLLQACIAQAGPSSIPAHTSSEKFEPSPASRWLEGGEASRAMPAAPDTKARGVLAREPAPLLGNFQRKTRSARLPRDPRGHQTRGPSAIGPSATQRSLHGSAPPGLGGPAAAAAEPRAGSPPPPGSVAAISLPAWPRRLGRRAPGRLGRRPQEAPEVRVVLLFATEQGQQGRPVVIERLPQKVAVHGWSVQGSTTPAPTTRAPWSQRPSQRPGSRRKRASQALGVASRKYFVAARVPAPKRRSRGIERDYGSRKDWAEHFLSEGRAGCGSEVVLCVTSVLFKNSGLLFSHRNGPSSNLG